MHRVETLVVGAGQAGLAVSRCLAEQDADHVVIERGRIAERWRTARWESLRLITPNWMSRLPGWSYSGTDPDGYMAAPELVSYLEDYAGSFAAPVHQNTTVGLVEASGGGLRVVTDRRTWLASNVIVATGTENRPYVPPFASAIDPGIRQLAADRYQGPHQVPGGGVLVVGASASGAQIADERSAGTPGSRVATGAGTFCGGWSAPGSSATPSIRCTTHGLPAQRRRCSSPGAAITRSAWTRSRRAE